MVCKYLIYLTIPKEWKRFHHIHVLTISIMVKRKCTVCGMSSNELERKCAQKLEYTLDLPENFSRKTIYLWFGNQERKGAAVQAKKVFV